MDIRPEVREACSRLLANHEDFIKLELCPALLNQDPLNQTETDALIAALSANTHVKTMLFLSCHRSGPANSAFLNFLIDTLIPNHPSLEELFLTGNRVSAEGIAGALKRNARMKTFFISGSSLVGNTGVRALAEGLRHNSSLTSFHIMYNGLGPDGCQKIVSSISTKPNFKLFEELSLNGNNIGIEGAKVIADFIPKAKSLKSLHVGKCSLGDEGCQIIASALPKTRSLQTLLMCANDISDTGCRAVAVALRENCSLCVLSLKGNNITDIGAAALQASLLHLNFQLQTLPLFNNEGVTDEKREQIDLLCRSNCHINKTFEHLKRNLPKISLALWPKALEVVETKPDLLFTLIKAKPDVFRERGAQRKRKCPELH